MRLLVVDIIFVEGRKRKRAVGWKRALHDGGVFKYSTVGIEMDDLDIHRLLSRDWRAWVF